jgi:hypothetical protein
MVSRLDPNFLFLSVLGIILASAKAVFAKPEGCGLCSVEATGDKGHRFGRLQPVPLVESIFLRF